MVKLINVTTIPLVDEKLTYEESLLKHLESLTDAEKQAKVSVGMVMADTSIGIVYTILDWESLPAIIGLLEILKTFIIEDFT